MGKMTKDGVLRITKDPLQWSVTRPKKNDRASEICGMPVLRINYGVREPAIGKSTVAGCYMRESIYQALCDGTLTVLTADTPCGFIVVDRQKKLSTPVIFVQDLDAGEIRVL